MVMMPDTGMETLPFNAMQGPSREDAMVLEHLKQVLSSQNLAEAIPEEKLKELGHDILSMFELDQSSMEEWDGKMREALKLATLMEKEAKTYPWVDASNIRYPLITSAALQYNARAYPALVPSTDVVKVAVQGDDRGNDKANRAERVSQYMSWQCKTESREWERGTDQLTIQLPIVGDVFRKLWFDPARGRFRCQVRLPGKHIVVNNNATCLEEAPRVSDQIMMYPHEIATAIRSGRFIDFDYPKSGQDVHEPEEFIEQLCRYDLDEDDYPEPYIITVHKETQKVCRVVAAYDLETTQIGNGQIVEALPDAYLVHYQFWPSMEGGFFGMGMGILLGDISDTVNTTLNLIMDGAHLSSLGGGFIGSQNFRVKGGVKRISPGQYEQVNFTGDDIRKGIVPMNFPEPSNVLFQVLGMMIDAGREMASISEIMTGDVSRQNMPVGTTMALIEQGMMVFTASYKRVFRSMQDEFSMIAKMNRKWLDPMKYQQFLDEPADPAQDFDLKDMDIQPVADPKSVTSMQKMGRAQFLLELATQGLVDPMVASQRVLEAAAFDDIEELLPKPDPMAPIYQQAQEEMMVIEIRQKEADLDKTIAETMAQIAKAEKDAADADMAPLQARIDQAKVMKEVIGARREAIEARSAERMARAPGNAGGSGTSQQGK